MKNKTQGGPACRQAGQTIIEVLVAFGVAVILVAAITIVILSALSNAQFSKNQNLATQYAQQGMEVIRQMRNSDLTTFNGISEGDYCLDKNSTSVRTKGLGCGTNIDGVFVREVNVDKNSSLCANVATGITVSVSWSDSKCTSSTFCHITKLVSCLSDYTIVPTP